MFLRIPRMVFSGRRRRPIYVIRLIQEVYYTVFKCIILLCFNIIVLVLSLLGFTAIIKSI